MSSLPWDFLLRFLGTPVSRQYNQYFRALYGLPRWNHILLFIYVTYWVGGERLTLHTGVRFNPRSGHVGIIVDVVERGNIIFFFPVLLSNTIQILQFPHLSTSLISAIDPSLRMLHYANITPLSSIIRRWYNSPVCSRSNKGFRYITPQEQIILAT